MYTNGSRQPISAKHDVVMHCGKAELWLSPWLRCSNSLFWRNSGETPVKFW